MTDWSLARCIGKSNLFFSEQPSAIKQAKKICANCPIKRDCLKEALENQEAWGIWAGLGYQDLRIVATSLGYPAPSRRVEHGTERGWAWHRRQREKDPKHVTCQDCIDAYNKNVRVRVARYRKRKSYGDTESGAD